MSSAFLFGGAAPLGPPIRCAHVWGTEAPQPTRPGDLTPTPANEETRAGPSLSVKFARPSARRSGGMWHLLVLAARGHDHARNGCARGCACGAGP
jgi:hypothetical protein